MSNYTYKNPDIEHKAQRIKDEIYELVVNVLIKEESASDDLRSCSKDLINISSELVRSLEKFDSNSNLNEKTSDDEMEDREVVVDKIEEDEQELESDEDINSDVADEVDNEEETTIEESSEEIDSGDEVNDDVSLDESTDESDNAVVEDSNDETTALEEQASNDASVISVENSTDTSDENVSVVADEQVVADNGLSTGDFAVVDTDASSVVNESTPLPTDSEVVVSDSSLNQSPVVASTVDVPSSMPVADSDAAPQVSVDAEIPVVASVNQVIEAPVATPSVETAVPVSNDSVQMPQATVDSAPITPTVLVGDGQATELNGQQVSDGSVVPEDKQKQIEALIEQGNALYSQGKQAEAQAIFDQVSSLSSELANTGNALIK